MNAATHTLGIDIAKGNFEVNLRSLQPGQPRSSSSFPNNLKGFGALQRWLVQQGITQAPNLHACLESTSRYGDALAGWLHSQGYQVSMVNPRRTRHYADSQLCRTVNDEIDAAIIADFCVDQRDKLLLWEPLTDEHRQLRDLTRMRAALVEHRDGLVNLLESAAGLVRKAVQRQQANLTREIQRLELETKKLLNQIAGSSLQTQVALAQSVPSVGLVTATTVLAELPPIDKIAHVNQAVALAGLDPVSKTSGTTVKTPARISKMGSKRIRRALYMPALVALRYNPPIKALGERLRAKGRSGKYVVVAAMRKLLRLIFGVVKNAKPFDPQWAHSHRPQLQEAR